MRSRRYVINRVGMDGKAGSIPGVTRPLRWQVSGTGWTPWPVVPRGPVWYWGRPTIETIGPDCGRPGTMYPAACREGSGSHLERLTIVPLGRTSPPAMALTAAME